MLEESTREMLDNLRALREATATTIAFETKAKREQDMHNARIKNLERQAEEALKQGNEKLARRALQLQVEARATAERAVATYKAAKARADHSRDKLKVEEERIQAKIRQLGELKAIHAMNEAQRKMQSITDEYNIDGAVNVFDKTAGTIQEQADKLSAMDTIAVSEGDGQAEGEDLLGIRGAEVAVPTVCGSSPRRACPPRSPLSCSSGREARAP